MAGRSSALGLPVRAVKSCCMRNTCSESAVSASTTSRQSTDLQLGTACGSKAAIDQRNSVVGGGADDFDSLDQGLALLLGQPPS